MSNGIRQIGLFGVAGVLVAALIIAGFVIGGNIFQVSGKGVLTIQIMDEPVELERALMKKGQGLFEWKNICMMLPEKSAPVV